MKETKFNTEDVIKVAKALLEDHTWFDTGDYSKDVFNCGYCSAKSPDWAHWETAIKDLKHDMDCPVLAARDLLTRFEEK